MSQPVVDPFSLWWVSEFGRPPAGAVEHRIFRAARAGWDAKDKNELEAIMAGLDKHDSAWASAGWHGHQYERGRNTPGVGR